MALINTGGVTATQTFASSWQKSELHAGGKIYTEITGVQGDQPTTRSAVKGTSPYPLDQTVGSMDLGEGTITFSTETERARFISDQGQNYREKKIPMLWIARGVGKPEVKHEFFDCTILSEPLDHSDGEDALGGEVTFTFQRKTINGLNPHELPGGVGGGGNGGIGVGL
jgi:hypothetical protein